MKFVILTCDNYLSTRVKSQRETFLANQKRIFLTDSSNLNIDDVIGYDTPKNYDGIQRKYYEFFRNYSFDDEYYFFIDDDTFVITDRIKNLYLKSPDEKFCIFRQAYLDQNGLDLFGNYTGYPMYKISGIGCQLPISYPSGGSGFIISRAACRSIKEFVNKTTFEQIAKSGHSDVTIGFWLRYCEVEMIKNTNFWFNTPDYLLSNCIGYERNEFISRNGWFFSEEEKSTAITFHYVNEEKMHEYNKIFNQL